MDFKKEFEILDLNVAQKGLVQLKENWKWYLTLGIGLVILGTLALIFSVFTTLFSVIYLGLFLIIVGIFEGFKSFSINKWSSFFLHLFLAVLYTVAGIFIVFNPLANALSLTILLAIFFVVTGILKLIFSFSSKILHKGWLAFNGLLSIALGILIWAQWPYSGLWVIGTFVAIDTLMTGWTWIMLALKAKDLKINNPV